MRQPHRWLALGISALLMVGMDDPTKTTKPAPKSTKGAKKSNARDRDAPPPCLQLSVQTEPEATGTIDA